MARKRTYTGCWTCRVRKIKCDLSQPSCGQCIKSRTPCGGYSVRLRWPDSIAIGRDVRRSIEFVQYPPDSMYRTYDKLEGDLSYLDAHAANQRETLVRGPFAVFNGGSASEPPEPTEKNKDKPPLPDLEKPLLSLEEAPLEPYYSREQPTPVASFRELGEELIGFMDSGLMGTMDEMLILDDQLLECLRDPSDTNTAATTSVVEAADVCIGSAIPEDDILFKGVVLEPMNHSEIYEYSQPSHGYALTSLAHFLFHHYETKLAPSMSMVSNSRNIWQSIFVPRVQSAIGDITNHGKTTSARFATVYGAAAASAYHIVNTLGRDGTTSVSVDPKLLWFKQIGDKLYKSCKFWLFKCFRGTNIGKYKDFLVANFTTSNIEFIKGDYEGRDIRVAVLEGLISRRLHHRPKVSNKARLLHLACAFAVLLTKVAICWPDNSGQSFTEDWLDVVYPDPMQTEAERLRFYEVQRMESRQIPLSYIANAKDLDVYFHQYDIEIAKTSEAKTSELMFALPESLIYLLKECVKYSRSALWERTRENKSDDTFSRELSLRCTMLEANLYHWPNHYKTSPNVEAPGSDVRSQRAAVIHHHAIAFYEALVVYHYRIAKDLNRNLLQPSVTRIIDHWEAIMHINEISGHVITIPSLFSGFIGACEVVENDEPLKTRFKSWFKSMERYGLACYKDTAQLVEEIYHRREQGEQCDWWNLVRDNNVLFTLQ